MTQSEKGKLIPFCFPNILVDEMDLVNNESSDFDGLKSSKKAVHVHSMNDLPAKEESSQPGKKQQDTETTPRRRDKQRPFEKVLPSQGGYQPKEGKEAEKPRDIGGAEGFTKTVAEKHNKLKTRHR